MSARCRSNSCHECQFTVSHRKPKFDNVMSDTYEVVVCLENVTSEVDQWVKEDNRYPSRLQPDDCELKQFT
jgi:hypothetical protein